MVLKGITVAGEESSEELKDVSVFQFSDGNLYKEEQLTPGQGGQSEISAVSGSRLYFLTGLEIPAGEKAKVKKNFVIRLSVKDCMIILRRISWRL